MKDTFREAGLLSELLEILGVWVLIDCEIRLHGAQLVVLERGAHPFRALLLLLLLRRAAARSAPAAAPAARRSGAVVHEALDRR